MVGVLVDACGWIALIEADLNIDNAMIGILGEFELKVIESVKKEIERKDVLDFLGLVNRHNLIFDGV